MGKMNILDKIAERTRERIRQEKQRHPLFGLREEAERLAADERKYQTDGIPFFEKALRRGSAGDNPAFICEVKRASPSKGLLSEDYPYIEIAGAYASAGASAVSCLTEPFWFRGDDSHLSALTQALSIPVLRKDFTVDPYMIYQAKMLGASAVLLICTLLEKDELKTYLTLIASLGMTALTEVHDERELETALTCGAAVVGVNNRNLRDFSVDLGTSIRLSKLMPKEVLFVSESGIRTREDVALLRGHRVDAVLVGETLMRAPDKKSVLDLLRGLCAQG